MQEENIELTELNMPDPAKQRDLDPTGATVNQTDDRKFCATFLLLQYSEDSHNNID